MFCVLLFLLSDSFDFQFGAVILRLKEGLDVSHIQGPGNACPHTTRFHAGVWGLGCAFQSQRKGQIDNDEQLAVKRVAFYSFQEWREIK